MWRIYAQDKMGVKVKTSVVKLFSQFYKASEVDDPTYLSCFIGKVKYAGIDELKNIDEHVANILVGDGSSRGIPSAQTLLLKRNEFSHEAEVRLLYVEHYTAGKGKLGPGMRALLPLADDVTFKFSIDPSLLIDEIVIDPRMTEHTCNAYMDYIKKIGFNGPIYQSSLYKSD